MEPVSSLPCSQEPSTGPYPEPDQSNPYHSILLTSCKYHFGRNANLFTPPKKKKEFLQIYKLKFQILYSLSPSNTLLH
jgi:hypothetical protein